MGTENTLGTGTVVSWSMPLSEKPYPLYKLTVDGIEVPVWSARVREEIHRPADAGWTHMYNGGTDWCGFARFDFTGSVEVAVTVARDFDSAEIVPRSVGTVPTVDGRTVHFRMNEPQPLTLLLDGLDREPLHLFTHRPETDVPSPDDPDVVYFGPGEHWVDTIKEARNAGYPCPESLKRLPWQLITASMSRHEGLS